MPASDVFVIDGATVILEDRLDRVRIRVEAGRITDLDGAIEGAEVIDARGLVLAPAFVDIHGDAFERQVMPRPGVMLPLAAALLETDRQLAANGIATAYHALTLSWEPGLRSVETGRAILNCLTELSPRLLVENRLQLRWETFCFEAIDLIRDALKSALLPSIAFNDHTSMIMLDPRVPVQERPFDFDPDFPVADADHPRFRTRLEDRARRMQTTVAEAEEGLRAVWARRPEVPAAILEVAAAGRAAGAAMLSHDDSQLKTRDYYRGLGARISEFPMSEKVAEAARAAGDMLVFGAPNAARGGSHLGASPNAAEMIRAGLCDILASDYYYPALLLALARLHAERVAPLHALWPLVSRNPAQACGLHDRGTIAAGKRADLILIDWPEGQAPRVRQTFVAGRRAYSTMAAG
ncbi:phosphonate metabolism protein PhnM [Xaviernesmea oryzae]|uniref:Phosphonate metabolism protein PhnM n=1 Tax=Xaviernesmea oryzae TaxID=464029 RepID=A0A1Q9AUT6_9HYPH|nr:alpha-D-ribose 1-methylphosphonate 5-triphosphate diphosphatase [Xaviernesmea oryzae]OLP59216.1 phosphonate metabolism protein PhnM [Xaviernesmea oryzae]SEK81409.1 alpha-D-ribose 1-methylphosphonate 5-triphosphate diphosphatase [Xaviernesmea oryzae]